MSRRWKIRSGKLSTVFPFSGEDPVANRLTAQLARLCVLHEDLRLEITEFHERPRRLGEFTPEAHRLYFMRRAIATLQEFSDAIVSLDKEASFSRAKEQFASNQLQAWEEAVSHFKRLKH